MIVNTVSKVFQLVWDLRQDTEKSLLEKLEIYEETKVMASTCVSPIVVERGSGRRGDKGDGEDIDVTSPEVPLSKKLPIARSKRKDKRKAVS